MNETKKRGLKWWFQRLGFGAFMFFLLKGIVWLVIFALAAKSCA
ncbi:hypothetical protein [Sphingobacterium allocomposti]|nr:hypothetical protein [Sphingobacterium composti Yoo et al. 2007 non Ten et al. 2007]HLS94502.1 hypothetical protein [Sphingobacterium sp.]